MDPGIRLLTEKKLVGKRLRMSFSDNRTGELWKAFMQRRSEIRNTRGTDLYSMQVYDHLFFSNFSPVRPFEKWAAAISYRPGFPVPLLFSMPVLISKY